jgi:hypothetical protein
MVLIEFHHDADAKSGEHESFEDIDEPGNSRSVNPDIKRDEKGGYRPLVNE